MHSNILGPMRAAPGPVRTEPIQFVLHAAAPLLGAGGGLPAKAEWLERRKGWPL